MSVQHSPLFHQWTCGVIPIGGRTVIRKKAAATMAGSLHVPEQYQGRHQEDWEAEVVAVASSGGWRIGVVHEKVQERWGHLEEKPPESLTKKEREDSKIWKIAPYFVEKPVLPPGSKIICCWLSGQPFIAHNGYDYFLTDGEHAYKAVVNQPA